MSRSEVTADCIFLNRRAANSPGTARRLDQGNVELDGAGMRRAVRVEDAEVGLVVRPVTVPASVKARCCQDAAHL
ncbi:hypothetical protein SAMN05421806_11684 [Streptomyces indicus]|uniref:Uncharacterized protein n=1 Tax=Streptomyces indicus TaxID=417292 RepID=A0A1G9GM94_9ACTN|nr:hypothetical protein SAMN05421806_11684 [Streptomyces indicus]